MSELVPYRGPLTDAFVQWMRDSPEFAGANPPILVGDGKVPGDAGWPQGKIGEGLFVSSVTVATEPAVPAHRDAIGARHTSWQMSYGVKTIAGSRTAADAVADAARTRARAFPREELELGPERWRISEGIFARLATVTPRGETDQETWEVADTVTFVVTRAR